jgi:protoporphyrinogen oxidase
LAAAIVYALRVKLDTLRRITDGAVADSTLLPPRVIPDLGTAAARHAGCECSQRCRVVHRCDDPPSVRLFGARTNTKGAERYGYVPGGYARILAVLCDKLESAGIEIRCSTPIEQIGPRDGGIDVMIGVTNDAFDQAVITVPVPLVPKLVPELAAAESARLAAIPYAGVVCASLLLDKPVSPYYIVNITNHWVPFSAIIEFSNVTGTQQFDGKSLVYLPKYVATDDPLFLQDDDA